MRRFFQAGKNNKEASWEAQENENDLSICVDPIYLALKKANEMASQRKGASGGQTSPKITRNPSLNTPPEFSVKTRQIGYKIVIFVENNIWN